MKKLHAAFAAGILLAGTSVGSRAAHAAGDAPNPLPPQAPVARPDDEVAGERCIDEAARWIAKGEPPPQRLTTMHCDIDYAYDDGSTHDERRMELWYRNSDGFRAETMYGGIASTLLLVGDQGRLIRERIHRTNLNTSLTYKELMPLLKNYRAILQEVGRLMAPAGLKSPGAKFRLLGTVKDAAATGGMWFKVIRTAPREGDMTFFFGSGPTKDGKGIRALAPDRILLAGEPGSNYAGDEYRLDNWLHDSAAAKNEQFRYPQKMRLYAIGIDKEEKPTMRGFINYLEINVPLDPDLFDVN